MMQDNINYEKSMRPEDALSSLEAALQVRTQKSPFANEIGRELLQRAVDDAVGTSIDVGVPGSDISEMVSRYDSMSHDPDYKGGGIPLGFGVGDQPPEPSEELAAGKVRIGYDYRVDAEAFVRVLETIKKDEYKDDRQTILDFHATLEKSGITSKFMYLIEGRARESTIEGTLNYVGINLQKGKYGIFDDTKTQGIENIRLSKFLPLHSESREPTRIMFEQWIEEFVAKYGIEPGIQLGTDDPSLKLSEELATLKVRIGYDYRVDAEAFVRVLGDVKKGAYEEDDIQMKLDLYTVLENSNITDEFKYSIIGGALNSTIEETLKETGINLQERQYGVFDDTQARDIENVHFSNLNELLLIPSSELEEATIRILEKWKGQFVAKYGVEPGTLVSQ